MGIEIADKYGRCGHNWGHNWRYDRNHVCGPHFKTLTPKTIIYIHLQLHNFSKHWTIIFILPQSLNNPITFWSSRAYHRGVRRSLSQCHHLEPLFWFSPTAYPIFLFNSREPFSLCFVLFLFCFLSFIIYLFVTVIWNWVGSVTMLRVWAGLQKKRFELGLCLILFAFTYILSLSWYLKLKLIIFWQKKLKLI